MENSVYQTFLVRQLGAKINARLRAAEKPEIDPADTVAVFENLSEIFHEIPVTEFGVDTGRKFRYLGKAEKVMILRALSLTAALNSEASWDNGKKVIRASAALYFDRNDQKPVASYAKTFSTERLLTGVPFETATLEQLSNVEGLARGIVETRCLSRFGIGEWVDNEADDEFDPENALSKADKAGEIQPTVLVDAPSAAPARETPVEPPAEGNANEVPFAFSLPEEPKAEPVPESVKEPKAKADTKKEAEKPAEEAKVSGISLEDARSRLADVGVMKTKGYNLGYVEEQKPRNLIYCYNHTTSEATREAIRVIARNNTVGADLMKENEGNGTPA